MPDMDALLEEKLEAIETGTSIEDVLNSLPDEAKELASLISLAQAVRVLPHPELSPARSSACEQKMLAAALAQTQPLPQSTPAEQSESNTQPVPATQPKPDLPAPAPRPRPAAPRRTRWILPRLASSNRWAVPVMAGVAAVLVTCMALAAGIGLWLSGPSGAKAATLMDVNGYVEVQSPSGAWTVAEEGEQIRAGESLRTSGASAATLLYYDGSRTSLGANTSLTLKTLNGQWGKRLQVELVQTSGKTSHSVVPLKGKSSAYRVEAPGGVASVHGTKFNVDVKFGGESLFAVNTGQVEVINPNSRVFVTAGQITAAEPGQAAESPAYQFNLQGTLASIKGNTWIVAGAPFSVTSATSVSGKPVVGDDVRVEGRIQENGTWVADTVQKGNVDEPSASFTGTVQATGKSSWQVENTALSVNGQTQIDPGIQTGDAVRVNFRVTGNHWTALAVSSLAEPATNDQQAPKPKPVPGAKPALEFTPDKSELTSCEASFDIQGGLANQGEEPDDVAANVRLGYTIDMGAQYVKSVSIDPQEGWDSIAQGDTAAFSVSVRLNQPAWDQASAKKVVKLRVFVSHETNRPDHLKSKMTITIDGGDCKPTETPEPSETAPTELNPSETPTVEPGVTPTPETLADVCTGANPQPTGMKLAERYGVDYTQIMSWFCNNQLGFGEIEAGYNLSLETGVPVEQIFQMRSEGLGWGQIKQQLLEKDHGKPTIAPAQATEEPNGKPTKKPKPSKP